MAARLEGSVPTKLLKLRSLQGEGMGEGGEVRGGEGMTLEEMDGDRENDMTPPTLLTYHNLATVC